MQMKKIVSVVAAAAMAAAFCVPAYAATPGEVAGDLAQAVAGNVTSNWDANKAVASELMGEMTSQIKSNPDITVTQEMNDAALLYFDVAEGNKDDVIAKSVGVEPFYGTGMVYRKAADASDLTVNSFDYNGQGVITVDATEGSTPSEYGYAISVTLPADGNNNYYYEVSMQDGQEIAVTVPVTSYMDENGQQLYMITFWAPHFTTYVLTPVDLNGNDQTDEENPDESGNQDGQDNPSDDGNQGGEGSSDNNGNQGGEQQTVTSDDSSSSSSDESTAASTTTATTATVAENPIKATGVSMNLSVFAVVACAAVAACGAGVAVKKSHKGE